MALLCLPASFPVREPRARVCVRERERARRDQLFIVEVKLELSALTSLPLITSGVCCVTTVAAVAAGADNINSVTRTRTRPLVVAVVVVYLVNRRY